jgi:hypothetical protein
VAGYIFFLAPFYSLWNEFSAGVISPWRFIIVFQVVTILAMRLLVDNYFKEPVISAFLHPIGFSFLFLNALYAGARRVLGSGIRWKDRLYGKGSSVE